MVFSSARTLNTGWLTRRTWNSVVARSFSWSATFSRFSIHSICHKQTNKQNKKEPGRRAMYLVKQVAPPPLLFQFFQFSERVIDCLTQLWEILEEIDFSPRCSNWHYILRFHTFGSTSCKILHFSQTFAKGERSGRRLRISLFFSSAVNLPQKH